jgi:hypothetical protein
MLLFQLTSNLWWKNPARALSRLFPFVSRAIFAAAIYLIWTMHTTVLPPHQCDQIRRSFLLGTFLKITKVAIIFDNFFPHTEWCIKFDKTCVGLHFGRFFAQTHLVTLLLNWPRSVCSRIEGNRISEGKNLPSENLRNCFSMSGEPLWLSGIVVKMRK